MNFHKPNMSEHAKHILSEAIKAYNLTMESYLVDIVWQDGPYDSDWGGVPYCHNVYVNDPTEEIRVKFAELQNSTISKLD